MNGINCDNPKTGRRMPSLPEKNWRNAFQGNNPFICQTKLTQHLGFVSGLGPSKGFEQPWFGGWVRLAGSLAICRASVARLIRGAAKKAAPLRRSETEPSETCKQIRIDVSSGLFNRDVALGCGPFFFAGFPIWNQRTNRPEVAFHGTFSWAWLLFAQLVLE